MEDPVFKGNQNFKFEMDLDEAGKRLFGGEANAGAAFQIGQLRYITCIYLYIHGIFFYILCTYHTNKKNRRCKDMYINNINLVHFYITRYII